MLTCITISEVSLRSWMIERLIVDNVGMQRNEAASSSYIKSIQENQIKSEKGR